MGEAASTAWNKPLSHIHILSPLTPGLTPVQMQLVYLSYEVAEHAVMINPAVDKRPNLASKVRHKMMR